MATLRNHPGFWLRDDAAAAFDQAEADLKGRLADIDARRRALDAERCDLKRHS